jgi:DNA-binding protein H-NS
MDLDLSQLSVTELADLRRRLEQDMKNRATEEKRAQQREHEERRRAIVKQVHDLVNENGLNLNDVIKPRLRGTRRKDDSRQPPPPKYRNPSNGEQTWVGRGRKPNWMVTLLQQGKTLEELAI